MSEPYRGTVESDVEATKRREAEEEGLAKMTPLDRAKEKRDRLRMVFQGLGIANIKHDPVERAKQTEQYHKTQHDYYDACAEVDRLLAARNGGR